MHPALLESEPNTTGAEGRAGISGRCLDVRVRATGSAADIARVGDYLPPYWEPLAGRQGDVRYRLRPLPPAGDPGYLQALRDFESDLQHKVAQASRQYAFIHAGVVAWDGHCIVLPGYSFAGKSTLVSALVEAGATYYSDEYAVVDRDGFVHPWPRPLRLRQTTGTVRARIAPAERIPMRATLILICRYERGANIRPVEITKGAGVLAVMEHAVAIRAAPEIVFPSLRAVVETARVFRTTRGDASEAAAAIKQLTRFSPEGVECR